MSTCVTGKGPDRLLQEGGGRGGGLVVLHGQVHPARAAVDGHRQGALRRDAVAVAQLGQVLHVQVHKADLVLLEGAVPCAGAISGRQAVQAFGPEDAVNRVAVQVGQEGGDHKGEVVERKARGAAERADHGPLFLARLPGQLVRASRAVLAVGGTPLAPLADGLGGHPAALGEPSGTVVGAGDLGTHGRRGAGAGMDGKHQRLLAEPGTPRRSKRQACSSSAQPT